MILFFGDEIQPRFNVKRQNEYACINKYIEYMNKLSSRSLTEITSKSEVSTYVSDTYPREKFRDSFELWYQLHVRLPDIANVCVVTRCRCMREFKNYSVANSCVLFYVYTDEYFKEEFFSFLF